MHCDCIMALQLLYEDMGGLQPPHSQERQLLIYEHTIWQIQRDNPRKDMDIHIYSTKTSKPKSVWDDKTVVVVVASCKNIQTHLSPLFLSVLSFFSVFGGRVEQPSSLYPPPNLRSLSRIRE